MPCKRALIIVTILCAPVLSFAQHILSGTWEGQFMSTEYDLGQPRLVVEIYDFKDSTFTGITHLYYRQQKYEHYKILGWYDKKDSLLVFREVATIAVDLGVYGNCLGTYRTRLTKQDKLLFQHGRWVANIPGCSFTTGIWLQKKTDLVTPPVIERKQPVTVKPPVPGPQKTPPPQTKKERIPVTVIPKTNEPVKREPTVRVTPTIVPPKISQRSTDVQSLLEIAPAEKDSIRVDVYDNGEIDGDSVSVFVENDQVINKRMITAKPISFYVSLDKDVNPISHLRLVAESLGSIPPCTALMIVTTKTKRYEVRLSSNFSRNATVELFLKE